MGGADLAGPESVLSPLARLALAYAPSAARLHWLALLTLDARLAQVVRTAREPMLAQLRLAWWRDRFDGNPADWPKGEPLLASLAAWDGEVGGLVPLVDGWEALLGEAPLASSALEEFAEGRAKAAGVLARTIGADAVTADGLSRSWALADLALHTSHPDERAEAARLLAGTAAPRAPADLRPLAILAGLSARAVRQGRGEALSGPGALFAAIRIGLTGR